MKKSKCLIAIVCICMVSLFALILSQCGDDPPWNQAYVLPSEAHPENIDIRLSLPDNTFPTNVENILVTITNVKNKEFHFIGHLFLEKQTKSGWERLPYFEKTDFLYRTSVDACAKMGFHSKYLQKNTKLTAGQYRFVIYIENQPHTIEFHIR